MVTPAPARKAPEPPPAPQKKYRLPRLKLPELGERAEGYDGHYEWDMNEASLVELVGDFQSHVKKQKGTLLLELLGGLVPGGDDGRLNTLCKLLMHTDSEEALKESLLLAITIGSRPLVELILSLFVSNPYHERTGCSASKNFAPHMTPLMLACILDNFPIVQCLLLRGHSIQMPHYRSCECGDCKRTTVSSRDNMRLVDVMRAVSSEAFLWLATDDVIASCWSIVRDFRRLVGEDNAEYVETFRQLESNVQFFMAKCSDMAWRYEEFNSIAANQNHCVKQVCEMKAPRLQMARYAQMRQFTGSANVQTTMTSLFRDDWYNYGSRPKRDLWRTFRASIFLPFSVLGHMLSPFRFDTLEIPMARLFAHFTTFYWFLVGAIARPLATTLFAPDSNFPHYIEGWLYLYILGLILEKTLLVLRVGPGLYFSYWWRYFDMLLICSFICSFVFFVDIVYPQGEFQATEVDRLHWPSTYSGLLHEVFLSIGCVFAISKVFYYIQLLKEIGGSVISVGNCVGKVHTYFFIIIIIIFSFSVGMNVVVVPYADRVAVNRDGSVEGTSHLYDDIGHSTKSLFWTIFGYMGPSTFTTVAGNGGPMFEKIDHSLNAAILEFLGALYHAIIIIALMNLMTSLLVKKADEVLDNEELEFKYTRAAIYSEFLSWETSTPSPFNIVALSIHKFRRIHSSYDKKMKRRGEHHDDADRAYEDVETHFDDADASHTASTTTAGNSHQMEYYIRERRKIDRILLAMFDRFCASKECKYKSVFRSEFPKETPQPSRVAFMPPLTRPPTLDNTFAERVKIVQAPKDNDLGEGIVLTPAGPGKLAVVKQKPKPKKPQVPEIPVHPYTRKVERKRTVKDGV